MSELLPINFTVLRLILRDIKSRCGNEPCLVSATWDDAYLHITLARPHSGRPPFIMTFDDEEDFKADANKIMDDFVAAASKWFVPDEERESM